MPANCFIHHAICLIFCKMSQVEIDSNFRPIENFATAPSLSLFIIWPLCLREVSLTSVKFSIRKWTKISPTQLELDSILGQTMILHSNLSFKFNTLKHSSNFHKVTFSQNHGIAKQIILKIVIIFIMK